MTGYRSYYQPLTFTGLGSEGMHFLFDVWRMGTQWAVMTYRTF